MDKTISSRDKVSGINDGDTIRSLNTDKMEVVFRCESFPLPTLADAVDRLCEKALSESQKLREKIVRG